MFGTLCFMPWSKPLMHCQQQVSINPATLHTHGADNINNPELPQCIAAQLSFVGTTYLFPGLKRAQDNQNKPRAFDWLKTRANQMLGSRPEPIKCSGFGFFFLLSFSLKLQHPKSSVFSMQVAVFTQLLLNYFKNGNTQLYRMFQHLSTDYFGFIARTVLFFFISSHRGQMFQL